jgi:peroxiredoxin
MIEKALTAGDLFPSITLADHLSRPFDIAASAKLQPHVVTFYRGGWCPYCKLELRAYQKSCRRSSNAEPASWRYRLKRPTTR